MTTESGFETRRAVRAQRCFDGVHMLKEPPVLVLIENGLIIDVDVAGAEPLEGVAFDDLVVRL